MDAIPTRFQGTQFRSRLEARWAAFFDLLGWPWEYEPIDLDGYIPDFILMGFQKPILVEVKPVLQNVESSWADAIAKIDNSTWKHEAICVGAVFFGDCEELGIIREWWEPWENLIEGKIEPGKWVWDGCGLMRCSSSKEDRPPCGKWTPNIPTQSWRTRCCDLYTECGPARQYPGGVERLWREAGNQTQWKRKENA